MEEIEVRVKARCCHHWHPAAQFSYKSVATQGVRVPIFSSRAGLEVDAVQVRAGIGVRVVGVRVRVRGTVSVRFTVATKIQVGQ